MSIDETLADQVKITVVATGFDEARQRLQQIASTKEPLRPQLIEKMKKEEVEEKLGEDSAKKKKKGNGELPVEGTEFDIPAFLRQGR
jgi:cell division GTPase FtsZ